MVRYPTHTQTPPKKYVVLIIFFSFSIEPPLSHPHVIIKTVNSKTETENHYYPQIMFPYINKDNDVVEQRRQNNGGTNNDIANNNGFTLPHIPRSSLYLPPLPFSTSSSSSSVTGTTTSTSTTMRRQQEQQQQYDFHSLTGVIDILQVVIGIINEEDNNDVVLNDVVVEEDE